MKILIAIDGSAYTKKAVQYLIDHKDVFGTAPQLSCIFVSPALPTHVANSLGKATVTDYYQDETKAASSAALKKLEKAGLKAELIAKVGHPAEVISRTAEKGAFDLVIMGSHGNGSFMNLVMGSVATKVLSSCKVPVLLIR